MGARSFKRTLTLALLAGTVILLAACGGGATPQPPTPTASLSAAPDEIQAGETVELTWSATHVDSVSLSAEPGADLPEGELALSGTHTLTLEATTVFTLRALDAEGEVLLTRTATVLVDGEEPDPDPDPEEDPANSVYWTGLAGDGLWASGENWSSLAVPGEGDHAIIDLTGAEVLMGSGASTAVGSIDVRRGELTLSSATLTLLGDSRIRAAGSLVLAGSSSSTLDLRAGLNVASNMSWVRGTVLGGELHHDGVLTVTGALEIDARGDGTASRQLYGNLVNEGTVVLLGTENDGMRTGQFGRIENTGDGVFEIRGDADIMHNGDPRLTFVNEGLLHKSSGTGISQINSSFENAAGTIRVDTGTLHARSSGAIAGGTFVLAEDATADFGQGSSTFTLSGSLAGTGHGAVRLMGGTFQVAPAGASFDFGGGELRWHRGTILGGLLHGEGVLTNTGAMVIDARGDGTSGRQLSAHLINEGNIVLLGTNSDGMRTGRAGELHNQAGAVFEISGDADLTHNGDPRLTFINRGLLHKSAGAGEALISSSFDNRGGTVQVDAGTLHARSGGTIDGGTFAVASGAVVELGLSSSVFTLQGSITAAGAGQLRLAGGYFNVAATGATFAAGVLHWTGGYIEGSGTLTNAADIVIDGRSTSSGRRLHGTVDNQGHILLLTLASGTGMQAGQGAVLHNRAGAEFEIQGDGGIASAGGVRAVFNNAGLLGKTAGTGASAFHPCYVLLPGGTVDEASGTISLSTC